MRAALIRIVASAVLFVTAPAAAEGVEGAEGRDERASNEHEYGQWQSRAISLRLLPLLKWTYALQFEATVPGTRFVLAAEASVRRGPRLGDLHPLGLGVGLEGKYWVTRPLFLASSRRLLVLGVRPYAGARLGAGWTRLYGPEGIIGDSVDWSVTAGGGCRLVLAPGFELTPHVGIGGLRTRDLEGRLAPGGQIDFIFDVTAGWAF